MNYFVVCPYCGYELLKAENNSYIEMSCPSCEQDLIIEVKDNRITIKKVLSEKKEND